MAITRGSLLRKGQIEILSNLALRLQVTAVAARKDFAVPLRGMRAACNDRAFAGPIAGL